MFVKPEGEPGQDSTKTKLVAGRGLTTTGKLSELIQPKVEVAVSSAL